MAEQILLVDDDPWILRMVTAILEKKGYQIATAADGEEGLARAEQLRPDLIICDVMMPRVDGWTLVKTLRSRPELSLIPVIFLTALGSDEDRIRGFRLGADDYLVKPFRFDDLDQRVATAIIKGRAVRETAQAVVQAPKPPPAPAPRAKPQKPAGVHGQLEQLGLSSLLVILEMERKSGILRLERVGAMGRLFVRAGRIISARIDHAQNTQALPASGADAVYHMLTWASGRFDFSVIDVDMQDEINESTTALLMEGARRIDESNR